MRKKKHNADEIRFCQSRLHKQLHEFNHGERSYLLNVEWEGGHPVRMVVCEGCYGQNIGTLIKEITVMDSKIVAMAA